MSVYVRPTIDASVFRDRAGHVIDYGNRWAGPPPDDTYSVDTHPERFAPLHTIADVLIRYLRDTYDVDVDEGADTAADLLHPSYHDVVRSVRLRPRDPHCAPLTFVFTAYPGISLHAGLLNDFPYPICGCDACDSTWAAEADKLERHVLAVVTGGYRESLELRDGDPWVGFAFTYPDGRSSGGSLQQGAAPERLEAAWATLQDLSGGWSVWPRRTAARAAPADR